MLKNWYKGTDSGSDEISMFEGWSDEKLESYNIDADTYDHTNIFSRPAVLITSYCTQRVPYLTVIYIWDKMSDYFLSSRHHPLRIGRGEVGLADGDSSSKISTLSRNKRKHHSKGLGDVIKSVIDLCNSGGGKSKTDKPVEDLAIENQPLESLFALIDQHTLHLAFLKDNDMCGDSRKAAIISQIEDIFTIIDSRRGGAKKRQREVWILPILQIVL